MAHHRRSLTVISLALAMTFAIPASAPASEPLSIKDARKAALAKVKKLELKLRDTGAKTSGVPGCWRETKRAVGCLGMVRGADEFVRWRCAVPMTVRKPRGATASSRRVAVEFTDTMCSF